MSSLAATDYHFCTLNELQSPKQLPSLDFVTKIVNICHVPMTLFDSGLRNIYDRKNHILYINNYESYARTLKEKYGRSVASFEKQLKMMGFKKRKIKQHLAQSFTDLKIEPTEDPIRNRPQQVDKQRRKDSLIKEESLEEKQRNNRNLNTPNYQIQKQQDEPIKYMLVWKTNRPALIESQLEYLEQAFTREIEEAMLMKEGMERRKKQLDSKMETIIFHSLLNSQQNLFAEMDTQISSQAPRSCLTKAKGCMDLQRRLEEAVKQLRELSNESQMKARRIVESISQNSGRELEVFRVLIYKESQIHKAGEEQ